MKRVSSMAFVLASLLLATGCVTIGPGNVGVLWNIHTGTQPEIYKEGMHSLAAWNDMYIYDMRVMSQDEMLTIIASNGLTIHLDTSVRFRIAPDDVVALHKEIGPQYYKRVLEPVLRSESRHILARYTPEEIYATRRDALETEIRDGVRTKIDGKHIILEAVLIRDVTLPVPIQQAIDEKLAAEQQVLRMKFVLDVTRANAEQKRIEGQAIADYNKFVSSTLSPAIIDFERIQQLTNLSESSNAKTVVIGANANSQLLLGTTAPARGP